ncbi:MAG: hypothetical protein GY927_10980 [bacterium]|nr:hypothetical protein [bacterium]
MDDIDPLTQVHLDLAKGKTRSHFDDVLLLKNKAKDDFNKVAEKYFCKKTSGKNTRTGNQGTRAYTLKPK